jgi:hypothetical protein
MFRTGKWWIEGKKSGNELDGESADANITCAFVGENAPQIRQQFSYVWMVPGP